MKIFSLLIFCSLIAFILSIYTLSECNPSYNNGQVSLSMCSKVPKFYPVNECCMITYTDNNDETYHVCLEMDAKMLTHYEQQISEIKHFIDSYYYHPEETYNSQVVTLDDYICSSNYIKFSFLALLLILF